MPGFVWVILALLAALLSARAVLRPGLWRTEAPALVEILGAWAILTLVAVVGAAGLWELVLQLGAPDR
ncbi:MAG: hypothetical protein NZ849_07575 [Meiothermus sp.]|uniref:hypothetical protein n=1 Tax=Meiothermus sp. TaxID=1955249 RepID=UPI0025D44939|nr:hypothetical protein [Meiothermus sp.]MCS7057330.1 hypothetical protein [Meiothermus sp.]MCS7194751.1 hypothetical protein [Meiothermus sp.]MDW8091236.1 hypothetical protein [Meiothermus sp.]MDW8480355.1 hypothetical protein [Meiothermus sp.]